MRVPPSILLTLLTVGVASVGCGGGPDSDPIPPPSPLELKESVIDAAGATFDQRSLNYRVRAQGPREFTYEGLIAPKKGRFRIERGADSPERGSRGTISVEEAAIVDGDGIGRPLEVTLAESAGDGRGPEENRGIVWRDRMLVQGIRGPVMIKTTDGRISRIELSIESDQTRYGLNIEPSSVIARFAQTDEISKGCAPPVSSMSSGGPSD